MTSFSGVLARLDPGWLVLPDGTMVQFAVIILPDANQIFAVESVAFSGIFSTI